MWSVSIHIVTIIVTKQWERIYLFMVIMLSTFFFIDRHSKTLRAWVSLFLHLAKMNEQHCTTLSAISQAVLSNGQLPLFSKKLVNLPLLCLATFEKWWYYLSCCITEPCPCMQFIYRILTEYPLLPPETTKQKEQTIPVLMELPLYSNIFYCRGSGDLSQLKYFGQTLIEPWLDQRWWQLLLPLRAANI